MTASAAVQYEMFSSFLVNQLPMVLVNRCHPTLVPPRLPGMPINLRFHFHSMAMVMAAVLELVEPAYSCADAAFDVVIGSPQGHPASVGFVAFVGGDGAASTAAAKAAFGHTMAFGYPFWRHLLTGC